MTAKQDIESTRTFARSVDFSKTAADYRKYRVGFPSKFFDVLEDRGWIATGQHALDLGTGTGTIARGLAMRGLKVMATDPAMALLEQAAELDREAGVNVDYCVGRAESIEAADMSFDLVVAGQCWHWFDRAMAGAESVRVLKPSGRIVIAHFDWLPLSENVVEATEELILKYNPAWTMGGGTGLYPEWLQDLALSGFCEIETFSFDIDQPYTHDGWRGRIRASAGVKASLNPEAIGQFDANLAAMLSRRFPYEPLLIPHRVWAVSGVSR